MSDSLVVSAQLRMEDVCARFEAAWQAAGSAGPPPHLEEHVIPTAGSERQALLRELLLLDLHYRRQRGETPTAEDYQARFPGDDDLIRAACAAPPAGPAGVAEGIMIRGALGAKTMNDPERTGPEDPAQGPDPSFPT